MAPLFKDGSQLLNKGIDLARRRDFNEAAGTFAEAARKFQKEGDLHGSSLALAYGQLMYGRPTASTPAQLQSLAGLLDSLGAETLQPGARPIEAAKLARQVRLAASESTLRMAAASGAASPADIAPQYQKLAQEFMALGDETLFLEELFEGRTIPASSRVAMYSALAEEAMGQSLQATNPIEASQHFQSASLWWQQAGEAGRAGATSTQVTLLSTRARCWFCGREGAGLGVQLVTLPLDVSVAGLSGAESGPLPALEPSGKNVYACAGCYSSIRNLADAIALRHDAELAARIQVQLDEIKRQIAAVRRT